MDHPFAEGKSFLSRHWRIILVIGSSRGPCPIAPTTYGLFVCPSVHSFVRPSPHHIALFRMDRRTHGRTEGRTHKSSICGGAIGHWPLEGPMPHPPLLTTPLKWGIRVPMTTNPFASFVPLSPLHLSSSSSTPWFWQAVEFQL